MVETITPVVYGGRARWAGGRGAARARARRWPPRRSVRSRGGSAGSVGAPFGAPEPRRRSAWRRSPTPARRPARGSRPVPQLRRQVPDWWRTFFSPPVTAFLYGAGLGIGFLTFLATGALVVVTLAAGPVGERGGRRGPRRRVRAGAGAVRAARDRRPRRGGRSPARRPAERAGRRPATCGRRRSTLGVAAVAAFAAAPDAARGGAAASRRGDVAVAFAWAADREADRPPAGGAGRSTRSDLPAVARVAGARLGVPVAEALVPALALLGLPRLRLRGRRSCWSPSPPRWSARARRHGGQRGLRVLRRAPRAPAGPDPGAERRAAGARAAPAPPGTVDAPAWPGHARRRGLAPHDARDRRAARRRDRARGRSPPRSDGGGRDPPDRGRRGARSPSPACSCWRWRRSRPASRRRRSTRTTRAVRSTCGA